MTVFFVFFSQMDETLEKERSRHAQQLQDLEDKMKSAFQMVGLTHSQLKKFVNASRLHSGDGFGPHFTLYVKRLKFGKDIALILQIQNHFSYRIF